MLEHVKLNVHQLNMDHLYLQLLTPCINTKNKKVKKTSNTKLIVPSLTPLPHPSIATKKKQKTKKRNSKIPITYDTRNNQKNKNKINMNEELEVHWHPYTFHYHKPMLLERTKKIK
jgi:hypothetical protein